MNFNNPVYSYIDFSSIYPNNSKILFMDDVNSDKYTVDLPEIEVQPVDINQLRKDIVSRARNAKVPNHDFSKAQDIDAEAREKFNRAYQGDVQLSLIKFPYNCINTASSFVNPNKTIARNSSLYNNPEKYDFERILDYHTLPGDLVLYVTSGTPIHAGIVTEVNGDRVKIISSNGDNMMNPEYETNLNGDIYGVDGDFYPNTYLEYYRYSPKNNHVILNGVRYTPDEIEKTNLKLVPKKFQLGGIMNDYTHDESILANDSEESSEDQFTSYATPPLQRITPPYARSRSNNIVNNVINLARSFVGKVGYYINLPGHVKPKGYHGVGKDPREGYVDCSGLTQFCWNLFGINIGEGTGKQYSFGKRIGKDLKLALPGDLIVNTTGRGGAHVRLVSKNDNGRITVIESVPRYGVIERPLVTNLLGNYTIQRPI